MRVNGQRVASLGSMTVSGPINIDRYLRPGTNTVEFTCRSLAALRNFDIESEARFSYGFDLLYLGEVIWTAECGKAGRSPCPDTYNAVEEFYASRDIVIH